jgi:predicted amidohydrolase
MGLFDDAEESEGFTGQTRPNESRRRKANPKDSPEGARPANYRPAELRDQRLDDDERAADPAVMRLAIAQVNPTVGDLAGNRQLVEEAAAKAVGERADLVVLPEMVLTGYPPMDLLERDGFVRDQLGELDALLPMSRSIPIALGAVVPHQKSGRTRLHNAAVLLAHGERRAVRAKSLLPTYDVFDERRHFAPATQREPVTLQDGGPLLGLTLCEDTWVDQMGYRTNPVAELAGAGCAAILNLSASPWHVSKPAQRRQVIGDLARKNEPPLGVRDRHQQGAANSRLDVLAHDPIVVSLADERPKAVHVSVVDRRHVHASDFDAERAAERFGILDAVVR